MPLQGFSYFGRAVGATGQITSPSASNMDNQGLCQLTNVGTVSGSHDAFTISGILSYGSLSTKVWAQPETGSVFRTEITAVVQNLQMFDKGGNVILTCDTVQSGVVTAYNRNWFQDNVPESQKVRILPFQCGFVNLSVKGHAPSEFQLPAPFVLTDADREAYLASNPADPAILAQLQDAQNTNGSRSVSVQNFGTILFGQWELVNVGQPGDTFRVTMLRVQLNDTSPGGAVGDVSFGTPEGDGSPF
jgi:hypothetical protein